MIAEQTSFAHSTTEAPTGLRVTEPRRVSSPKAKREDNKLRFADRAAHDWYRFVLSFPPHIVRDYATKFGLSKKHRLLDPFCGTGTTVVEAKKLGIASAGLEANPVAAFASRAKMDWVRACMAQSLKILGTQKARLSDAGLSDRERLPLARCYLCPMLFKARG